MKIISEIQGYYTDYDYKGGKLTCLHSDETYIVTDRFIFFNGDFSVDFIITS